MNANDISANPNLRAQYIEWCNLPMTKIVMDIVRLEGRCYMPRPEYIKSEIALAAMGENSGYHNALDRVMTLDKTEKPQDNEIAADYGAGKIMSEQYPESKTQKKGT
jgi:hypothetical protein